MTWSEFKAALIAEGMTEEEAADYVVDLQEYPEPVQRILLAD